MTSSGRAEATRELARLVCDSEWNSIPAPVKHEAKRALLNWLGCALGGSREEAVDLAIAAISDFSGPAQATVLSRPERLDAPYAALVNAISSNVLDFDDTHLRTVIHPSVPVASALMALAEKQPVAGADLLHAFVLGVEVECRIGNAISPEHYDAGWHVTATCGVLGAAAACSKLLQLGERQTNYALSMAATQAGGLSEMLGSMTRMLNIGHAARNGLLAAWYAAKGLTSSERAIEAPRGYANAFSTRYDESEILKDTSCGWQISTNAYKPYPCGIVVHPVIDGCLELRARHAIDAQAIQCIELRVNPLTVRLTGNPAPEDGLRSKVSAPHAAAVAMIFGAAGMREFTDAVVQDPRVSALRGRVRLLPQEQMSKDAAEVCITLADGRQHRTFVAHAKGSLDCPLTDAELEQKLRALAEWGRCDLDPAILVDAVWALDSASDAGALARMTVGI